jgi:tetratricopeptide (TPR) repeat protein
MLETYPDFLLNAGGSAAEYVEGGVSRSAAWRDEMARQAQAHRRVLWGRLYEQVRGDFYNLLAMHQYRRALEIVPDHFVARSLLGITERQLEVAERDAEVPGAPTRVVEEWLGALIATDRFDEAAEWVGSHGRYEEWGPTAAALLGVLRKRPDEVRRVLAGAESPAGGASPVQVDLAALQAALEAQESVARHPDDAAAWLSLGDSYDDLAQAISRRTFRPLVATQRELIGLLHNESMQATATLQEMAAASYEKASLLGGDRATAEHRLSLARVAMGHYAEASELLRRIDGSPVDRQGNEIPADSLRATAAALRELEADRFGFLRVLRAEMVKPQQDATRLRSIRLPDA